MHRIAAVVAGLSLAIVGTSTTFAATINVPGDHATIQGAINASVNGDVINIDAGTYNEHSLNPGGKAITIGSASGNLDVTIDAQQGGSVFVIESGEGIGTVIQNLVITGGSSNYGGGFMCFSSSATITNCTISGNTADYYGGGISCEGSSPTITGCTISGNEAHYYYGGGIYCYESNPTISGCTVSGNTAYSRGGGIYCYYNSNPTISGCTISGNTAINQGGGGIYCYYSSNPTITISVICGNSPDQLDGIEMPGGSLVSDSCDIVSNTFGACCVSSGCVANSNDDCIALGGTWLGEDASCDDCTPSCNGDINADGTIDVLDLLGMLSAWGTCP